MKSASEEGQYPIGDQPEIWDADSLTGEQSMKPPEGGWGWVVVFGSFLVHLIADGITYAFGVFTPAIVDYYGASRQLVGWLNSALVGITFISGPLSSKLCDAYGFRIVTMLGGVIGAIGLGAVFFSANFVFFFVMVSGLGGLGFGLAYLASICVVSNYFERNRALAVGFAVCGSGVGTFLFAPLVDVLVRSYTWRGAMLILSGIMLNCCVCGALYRPLKRSASQWIDSNASNRSSFNAQTYPPGIGEEVNVSQERPSEVTPLLPSTLSHFRPNLVQSVNFSSTNRGEVNTHLTISDPGHYRRSSQHRARWNAVSFGGGCMNPAYSMTLSSIFLRSRASISRQLANQHNAEAPVGTTERLSKAFLDLLNPYLLRSPVFLLFAFSNFLTSLGFNAPFLFAVDRAILQGIEPRRASFLVSSIGIGNTIGRVMFGALATRGGKRFRIHLYNGALVLCGLTTVASWWASTYPWMIAYTMAFGLLGGTYVTLTPVVLVDLLGVECLSDSFGLSLLFMGIAVLAGPPIAGAIFDGTGSYNISFAVCGFFILVSGLVMYPVFCLHWGPPKRTK
uniref:Monocarboxylate transporter 5 n=1 Tax=Schistocephalus solidus TaxID=70667 RepID=A0A0V0J5Y8_SCHSO